MFKIYNKSRRTVSVCGRTILSRKMSEPIEQAWYESDRSKLGQMVRENLINVIQMPEIDENALRKQRRIEAEEAMRLQEEENRRIMEEQERMMAEMKKAEEEKKKQEKKTTKKKPEPVEEKVEESKVEPVEEKIEEAKVEENKE